MNTPEPTLHLAPATEDGQRGFAVAAGSAPEIHHLCDPDHQDLVNMLNNMARSAIEGDEKSYDGFYFQAMEMVDELHKELSQKAGWPE